MRVRLAAAIGAVLIVAGVAAPARAQLSPQDRVLVIPFDNPGHEGRIFWLGEASAILLADSLNASGVQAYTREERLEAFEKLQVPPVASLSHATVIRLGQIVGATNVVIGSVTLSGANISVHAQNIRLDTGRMETDAVESGALENLIDVFDRICRRLAPKGNDARPRRPPLQVFENYVKGLLAGSTPTKISYLQSALKLDPSFDRARLALWDVNEDSGNAQAALVAATGVPETSPLYASARFSMALSLIQLKRYDDAFATLRTLADRMPTATIMNNLGVVQLRRGGAPSAGKPVYYFNEAVKLDAADGDYFFNLGYGYWLDRDNQGAIYWLREAVRRQPADGQAHALLAMALQSVGSAAEAARERALASQLSADPIDASARGLERVKPALEASRLQRVDMAIAESGQRDQRDLAAFHLDRGRRFFEQGNDGEAIAELRRTLYLSPYEAEAQLLLGRIDLRMGQTQAAIDAFKISLWSQDSAAAHLALAQAYAQSKDEEKARAEAQRALQLQPDSADARALLGTLKP